MATVRAGVSRDPGMPPACYAQVAVAQVPTLAQTVAALAGAGVPLLLSLGSVSAAQAAVHAVDEAGVR